MCIKNIHVGGPNTDGNPGRGKKRDQIKYIYRKKIRRNKTITYTKLYTIKTRKTTNKSIYIYLWYIYIQEITLKCSIEVICILNNNENIIKCISKIKKKTRSRLIHWILMIIIRLDLVWITT